MSDNAERSTNDMQWLLLIHQIPPKPDYLRVKIGRRLQRVGAVAVKNSVYVLPDREPSFEDLQWIRTEILDGGGDASICRAEFVDGLTGSQVRQLFRGARDADYAEITAAARELHAGARPMRRAADRARTTRPEDDLARLRKRFEAVSAIDFFDAPGKALARDALLVLESELAPQRAAQRAKAPPHADRAELRGRVWVTRADVFVDRIASAWLVRRFIDPDARFRFVREARYQARRGELRFDMFEGEFTHEGDRCTFETLCARFALDDPALAQIAEVVHDIDLKDAKFEREDARGIERVLRGIAKTHADDAARLERGAALFDELYALFASESSIAPRATQTPVEES